MENTENVNKAAGAPSGLNAGLDENFDNVYTFLREWYLHSRFEGSANCKDYPDYPSCVVKSTMEQIEKTGGGIISHFESRTGRVIIFDANLNILNKDEPPAQIQRVPGHLTHIMGA